MASLFSDWFCCSARGPNAFLTLGLPPPFYFHYKGLPITGGHSPFGVWTLAHPLSLAVSVCVSSDMATRSLTRLGCVTFPFLWPRVSSRRILLAFPLFSLPLPTSRFGKQSFRSARIRPRDVCFFLANHPSKTPCTLQPPAKISTRTLFFPTTCQIWRCWACKDFFYRRRPVFFATRRLQFTLSVPHPSFSF